MSGLAIEKEALRVFFAGLLAALGHLTGNPATASVVSAARKSLILAQTEIHDCPDSAGLLDIAERVSLALGPLAQWGFDADRLFLVAGFFAASAARDGASRKAARGLKAYGVLCTAIAKLLDHLIVELGTDPLVGNLKWLRGELRRLEPKDVAREIVAQLALWPAGRAAYDRIARSLDLL